MVIASKADKIAVTKVNDAVDSIQSVLNPIKDFTFLPFSTERKIYTENVWNAIEDILQISKGRWEIEESFRIMKSEFKARPVFLHKDERIKAHFTICFLSLLIYRILEKEKLQEKYSTQEIITTLKSMITNKIEGIGYKQLYKKTDITTALNNNYDFNLDKEFIGLKNMKKFINF